MGKGKLSYVRKNKVCMEGNRERRKRRNKGKKEEILVEEMNIYDRKKVGKEGKGITYFIGFLRNHSVPFCTVNN